MLNSHAKVCGPKFESSQHKHMRIAKATSSSARLRNLSGWNIFQRERLSQMGGLDPNQYTVAVNELSTEWASLSAEEQEAFQVQAAYEQQLREAAVHEPLPAKGVEASDLDLSLKLGSKALKKLSIARLQNNFDLAIKHKLWESPTQLGECFLARLPTIFVPLATYFCKTRIMNFKCNRLV